jgi:hypothetical protein
LVFAPLLRMYGWQSDLNPLLGQTKD